MKDLLIECIEPTLHLWRGRFNAMKSPCEILLECEQEAVAREHLQWAQQEALRIEQKFSRFQADSVIGRLNRSQEQWVEIDSETQALLDFADQCWWLSQGWIDVTVGRYFQLWRFDGKTPPPSRKQLKKLAPFVGWHKVKRKPGLVFLPQGVEIDLGGIGKEYAVDIVATHLAQVPALGGILVNFGGDIHAIKPRQNGWPWQIGVEEVRSGTTKGLTLSLMKGAIATSGTTHRFVVDKHGKPLGHILNPHTGWPVRHGPASVTVLGETAIQAGLLATLAMLKGKQAETFLQAEGVQYYCQWEKMQ